MTNTINPIMIHAYIDDYLFLDDNNDIYACVTSSIGRRVYPIMSKKYASIISSRAFNIADGDRYATKENISTAINIVVGQVETGDIKLPKIALKNRVAWDDEKRLCYDLSDRTGSYIRIDKEGWCIREFNNSNNSVGVDEYYKDFPILFREYQHQKPQKIVKTKNNNDIRELLKPYIHISDENLLQLFYVSLISKFIPEIPHIIDTIHGPQGSAKTTTNRVIKSIVDPSRQEVLSIPKAPEELVQILDHHYISNFDNITFISESVTDIICRAVTGDGITKRALYSDDEDFIRNYKRCITLNGIDLSTHRADISDRSILFKLDRISKCKTEDEFWGDFNNDKNDILNSIFNILSKAIKIYPNINVTTLPRMADFCVWGEAISRSIGYDDNSFISVFIDNQKGQNIEVIEANTVGSVMMKAMVRMYDRSVDPPKFQREEMLMADYYIELKDHAEDMGINTNNTRTWPKSPSSLSRQIKKLITSFAEEGFFITIFAGKKPNVKNLSMISIDCKKDNQELLMD